MKDTDSTLMYSNAALSQQINFRTSLDIVRMDKLPTIVEQEMCMVDQRKVFRGSLFIEELKKEFKASQPQKAKVSRKRSNSIRN